MSRLTEAPCVTKEELRRIIKDELRFEARDDPKIMREYKVFGVPTFIYKDEIFWGQDRIYALKQKINE